uniref:Helicase ATP-binding domain-containing protein n=1 Tax=viral metagenome TaxID=1070528 RepID=A0A6C0JAW7_9ZZZZ
MISLNNVTKKFENLEFKVPNGFSPIGYCKPEKFLQTEQIWDPKITLYAHQQNLLNKLNNKCILLNCYTGFGKTIFSLFLSSYFNHTLIIVPLKIVYKQWKRYIDNLNVNFYTTIDIKKITPSITLVMAPTLNNRLSGILDKLKKYNLVIIDECHLRENSIYSTILPNIVTDRLLGLTATLSSNDDLSQHYFSQTIKVSYKKIFFYKFISTNFTPENVKMMYYKGRYVVDYTNLLKQTTKNKDRMDHIINIIKDVIYQKKALILVKNVNTVKTIFKFLIENNTSQSIGFVCGSKEVPDLLPDILISTYQKLSVGFDTNKYNILILLDNIKDIRQSEGRLRNENFSIYDFYDNHPVFLNHKREREKWYKLRGGIIL